MIRIERYRIYEIDKARDGRRSSSVPSIIFVPMLFALTGSIVELQGELNDARGGRRDPDRAERGACYVQTRNSEVGMVERVEDFGAELEVLRFRYMQVFRQREIEVDQSRTAHHTDAGSPEDLTLVRIYRRECG